MKPQKRPLDGVLLLDKATGLSSNSALQQVRRLYRAEKAGHTGVLDPLATGLLPVCFGQATKFAQYLLDADKAYIATLRLGQATDTGDAEGNIIATSHTEISQAEFQVAFAIHSLFTFAPHAGAGTFFSLLRQRKESKRKATAGTGLASPNFPHFT